MCDENNSIFVSITVLGNNSLICIVLMKDNLTNNYQFCPLAVIKTEGVHIIVVTELSAIVMEASKHKNFSAMNCHSMATPG